MLLYGIYYLIVANRANHKRIIKQRLKSLCLVICISGANPGIFKSSPTLPPDFQLIYQYFARVSNKNERKS